MHKDDTKRGRGFLLLKILSFMCILLFPCVSLAATIPDPKYKDPIVEYGITGMVEKDKNPLAEFSNGSSNTYVDSGVLKNVTIGIILTNNTAKSMEYVKKCYDKLDKGFLGWKNYTAMEDLDASYLTKAVFVTLQQKFKSSVVLNDITDRKAESVDAVMYLDIKIRLGQTAGSQSSIDVQGIVVERNKRFIGQVKGSGAENIDVTFGFKVAANRAVENFSKELSGATALAARLNELFLANAPKVRDTGSSPVLQKVGGKRIALVIGNGDYAAAPLKNTIADAKMVASSLSRIGVETAYVENVRTAKDFVSVLKEFNNKAKDANVILFYYAGHGMQIQGRNYLVPTGAQLDVESDVDYECVDLERVLALLSDGNSAVRVAIIDACRDNPFLSSSRSLNTRGLSVVAKAPSETLIAYSTSPGAVALDGDGANGPFATAFAKVLEEKNLQIEEVFKKVRAMVNKATDGQQIPWESSSIEQEVVLNPESSEAAK